MPDLAHTLQGHDLGFLRAAAAAWGLELQARDARAALAVLPKLMLDARLAGEVLEALPETGRQALSELAEQEGRMLWAAFTRKYGEVRSMGAAKRDRERPDLRPASPAELLWYRALIGRAFMQTGTEPQEYAYIPDDLLELLPVFSSSAPPLPGRPATPGETAHAWLASDRVLDHACTFLAACRLGMANSELAGRRWQPAPPVLEELLLAARLLDANRQPIPQAVRDFLSEQSGAALARLTAAWLHSLVFDELRQLPGLRFEGEWENQPQQVRAQVLEWVARVPENTWWSLESFVAWVKEKFPDYQRPAGDYDSWFIMDEASGQYLRGFGAWEAVDGRLLRYFICGPLHWLGMVDLAAPQPGVAPAAFRLSAWAADLLNERIPKVDTLEEGKIKVSAEGQISAARTLNRAARYQLARFCAWGGESADGYAYWLTPAALERARAQGLKTGQLAALLTRLCSHAVAPALLQALERWESAGAQASLEPVLLLRVASAEILQALRASTAARHLGEVLNPTCVLVKPGGREPVRKALAGMGYLTAAELEELEGGG